MTAASDFEAFARAYADAWCSGSPEAVARFFDENGEIAINGGAPSKGRAAIAQMAQGFFGDFPGLTVRCDSLRRAGSHALFAWTLEGRHAGTGNSVRVTGWEEWDLGAPLLIRASLGWYDAEEFDRQVREGV
jgi:uncharacterized protein (TIGR02246 family)